MGYKFVLALWTNKFQQIKKIVISVHITIHPHRLELGSKYRVSGSFCGDLIFAFFATPFNSQIFEYAETISSIIFYANFVTGGKKPGYTV